MACCLSGLAIAGKGLGAASMSSTVNGAGVAHAEADRPRRASTVALMVLRGEREEFVDYKTSSRFAWPRFGFRRLRNSSRGEMLDVNEYHIVTYLLLSVPTVPHSAMRYVPALHPPKTKARWLSSQKLKFMAH